MRNLKRTLSLLLAAIMLIGMMVVGASAADVYDSFTDKDEIVNKDAVNLLTILNIINGKEDGSHFDPKGGVTRAEMAKMIAVVLNRGRDNSELYKNGNTGLTDVKGTWAEGSINFCYQQGIIAGRGDGRFDPTAPVTASEAAKMLLVAAGYDADIEGYVGANWSMNVNIRASAQGIYNNYNGDVMANLSRDDAALLIYNALDVEMIQSYTTNNYAQHYEDNRTILSSMYGVYKLKGVVVANEWAQLEETGVDDALAEGRTKVAKISTYESNTQMTNTLPSDMRNILNTTRIFNVSSPVNYMGKTVTMYIRKTTVLNDYEVLGMYLRDVDNDIVTSAVVKSATDVLKGSGLKTGKDTEYYVNYGVQETEAASRTELGYPTAKGNGIDVECIDNDLDGTIDYVLYLKRDLNVVTSVNADGDEFVIPAFNKGEAIDEEDIVTDLELAANDVVLGVTYGGRYYFTEPEVVTGVMTAYNASKLDNETITIDGTDYKASAIGQLKSVHTSANGREDIIDLDITLCEKETGVQFKTTYEFFLDTHGNIRAFRPTEESLPNYALILKSGYEPGVYSSDASGKVTVLLADGTEGTYSLNFSASASNIASQLGYKSDATGTTSFGGQRFTKAEKGTVELKGFLGTDYTDNSGTRPWRWTETAGAVNTGTGLSSIFAYKGISSAALSETQQARENYGAGNAAGYVIAYTLNDDNVLTIKNIIGGVGAKDVGDGAWNNYLLTNTQLGTAPVHTLRTTGNVLTSAYANGRATVVSNNGSVAVDKDTIAFYYTGSNDGEYGVAVGYSDMANVSNGIPFIASTKVSTTYNTNNTWTYSNTNLADVILFNECNLVTTRDYAYVLSANVHSNDDVTINVIFENGEAGTLLMDKDDFDDVFASNNDFKRAYAYSVNGKGYATLTKDTSSLKVGNGYRLDNGTIRLSKVNGTLDGYYPYDNTGTTTNIWNITNASAGKNAPRLTDLARNYTYAAYLVLDSNGHVRTAFVDEERMTGTTGSAAEPHNGHTWSWRNESALNSDHRILSASPFSASDVNTNLATRDVRVIGSTYGVTDNIYIPAGRILRVEGDLTLAATARIYGPGSLTVTGNLTTTGAAIEVANVFVGGKWTVTGSNTVGTSSQKVLMFVNEIDGAGANLTVAKDSDLHVAYNDGTTKIAVGADAGKINLNTLTIEGHMETAAPLSGVTTSSTVGTLFVNSSTTLILRGKLTVSTALVVGVAKTSTNDAKVGTMVVSDDLVVTGTTTLNTSGTVLQMSGSANSFSNAITGEVGAKVSFTTGADAAGNPVPAGLATGDNSGLKWTSDVVVDSTTAKDSVNNITFTIQKDAAGNTEIVATPDSVAEAEPTEAGKTVVVTKTPADMNNAYVTVNDTSDPILVEFKDGSDAETVTIEVTATGTNGKVAVSGDATGAAAAKQTITLAKDKTATTATTKTLTVDVSADGTKNVQLTIKVTNGTVTLSK